MRKHRQAVVRTNQSVNGDMQKLLPPSLGPPRMAPSVPGVHAPSHVPSAINYAEPYNEHRFVRTHINLIQLFY